MAWTATLNITNNTDYNLTVNRNTVGDLATIEPGKSWSYTTSDPNNTDALRFWKVPNQWYMQGSVAYGPEAGVYMDRGWMAEDDQSIVLFGQVNNVRVAQSHNGGGTVVPWNGFEQGGTISMTFNPVTK